MPVFPLCLPIFLARNDQVLPPSLGGEMPSSGGTAAEGRQMTSRCSEDCEGRVKINLCYCNSLPSGTFHGPTRLFCGPGHGHSAGLGARRPLGADGFFCLRAFHPG